MQIVKSSTATRLKLFILGFIFLFGSIWISLTNAQEPDQYLASQLSELQAKVARLEAALNHKSSAAKPSSQATQNAGTSTSGPQVSAKYQNCTQCHQTRPSGPLPASHLEFPSGNKPTTEPSATVGQQAPDKGMAKMGADKGMGMGMGMMEKMDKMMGMMEKMMSGGGMKLGQGAPGISGMSGMGGSASPTNAESKVMEKMDKLMDMMQKMLGGGAMQPAPAAPAKGGMPMM